MQWRIPQRWIVAGGLGALLCGVYYYGYTQTTLATMGMIAPSSVAQAETLVLPKISVRINIPATTLSVYKDGVWVKDYRISVGALAYPSPVMTSQFTQLIWNPSWIPPDSPWAAGEKPAPPGPHNPLGPMKVLLDNGIRIHGTNKASSVGRPASHGCFRMHNKDASELAWYIQQHLSDKTEESYREKYAKHRYTTFVVNLKAEVPVEIVYEPVEIRDETLRVHPDYYGRTGKKLKDHVMAKLSEQGISEIHPNTWQKIMIEKKKGTVTIPLNDVTHPNDPERHNYKD